MDKIKSQIESLLFISAKPMSIIELSKLTKESKKNVQEAGDDLVQDYEQAKGGLKIIKNGKKYQMVSAPENALLVQDFIKGETKGDLSRPSLETLTIIAYRGPISKEDLNQIRGVNCSLILRNLLLRGLIEEKQDSQTKQILYTVSFDFIRFLGINSLEELPDYEKLHSQEVQIDKLIV